MTISYWMSLLLKVDISYTMGMSALPNIYALAQGSRPEGKCVYIRQSTRAYGITITYMVAL